jgi:hypothetical protein
MPILIHKRQICIYPCHILPLGWEAFDSYIDEALLDPEALGRFHPDVLEYTQFGQRFG